MMLAGTGSDVGKSILATAFCRIFRQDGYQPAPFKAQNMALNSYATPEGLEIGRAQAVQAEAAGIPCHTDTNPLLLKPSSDHQSQVVLNGRVLGNRDAYDMWRRRGAVGTDGQIIDFRREVCDAFDRLSARYQPIVMEGAGSVSELNLRDNDLVNLPMARHAGADVFLVGVVPYYKDIHIEEEDSVDLAAKSMQSVHGRLNVAVVLLRHLSNFTDFNVLERDPRVHLFYTNNADDLLHSDIIILPGSKSTLPARLTACLMVLASGRLSLFRFVRKYGPCHASPNSGWPEAALAGILDCRFGGPHYYFGELFDKPYIGTNDRPLSLDDLPKSLRISWLTDVLALSILVLVYCLFIVL